MALSPLKRFLTAKFCLNFLLDLYLKFNGGHDGNLGGDDAVDAQIGKSASQQPASECRVVGGVSQVLFSLRDLGQELEFGVLKNVAAHMIGSQVVDLLLENSAPKVFAEEFHHLQLILEARRVFGEALDQSLPNLETQVLQLCHASSGCGLSDGGRFDGVLFLLVPVDFLLASQNLRHDLHVQKFEDGVIFNGSHCGEWIIIQSQYLQNYGMSRDIGLSLI